MLNEASSDVIPLSSAKQFSRAGITESHMAFRQTISFPTNTNTARREETNTQISAVDFAKRGYNRKSDKQTPLTIGTNCYHNNDAQPVHNASLRKEKVNMAEVLRVDARSIMNKLDDLQE